jgi:DNA-binding MarR family transcriptional regulator
MENHEDCIVYLLAKAYQRSHALIKERLKPLGLTPLQQLILAVLHQEDDLSAGEIGQRLVLDSATLSGTLERMEEKGWIRRDSDPADRRVSRVRLTQQAREVNAGLGELRAEVNQEILQGLSLEEKLLLKRMLRDLR